jgi:hypothetical protein
MPYLAQGCIDDRTLAVTANTAATDYITSLPKSESGLAEWRIAIEALLIASRTGPTAFARIAFASALTRNTQPGDEVPFFCSPPA